MCFIPSDGIGKESTPVGIKVLEVALANFPPGESFETFEHFVFNTLHGRFVKRRAEWFEHLDEPSYVIWPIEHGHIPSLTEGKEKLLQLKNNGPSPQAYDFAYGRQMMGGSRDV